MVRINAVSLLVSGACGARIAQHNVVVQNSSQHPVPTPQGYTFNWDDVYRCYAAANPLSSVPPGYKMSQGKKCPGKSLKAWGDGTPSLFARTGTKQAWKEPLECAKECNKHEECAGFYMTKNICSHWRQGELQDLPMSAVDGYDCYVKWESRDLSGAAPSKPKNEPAPPQKVPVPPKGAQVSDCLCVWDVDRTLTAKQGMTNCPGSKNYPDVIDYAYNGGTLILSELAVRMNETFCSKCYFSVVSAGTASGPSSDNRALLDGLVDPKLNIGGWVDGCPTPSWGSKVMCCGEGGEKKRAVEDIVSWMGQNGVEIAGEKVHFFDDKANNIEGFAGGPYNAHMVSCASRDGSRGGCGGTLAEVVDTPGQHVC